VALASGGDIDGLAGSNEPPGTGGELMPEDPNSEHARKLLYTAAQLMALARDLECDPQDNDKDAIVNLEPKDSILVELARQIYSARRKRSVVTEWEELFGEPAWDLILHLFIAAHESRDVSVSSACLGAGVPTTTALRWLNVLEEKGMVLREEDPRDHRRGLVRISTTGSSQVGRYLRQIADGYSAFVLLKPGSKSAASLVGQVSDGYV
jgi:hypothetical protein